jgi:hypothetical protein
MAVTPRPWRRSPKASDAIISDSGVFQSRLRSAAFEHYGGYVVAESIQRDDLEFILHAVEVYDKTTGGHAAACKVHDGEPCDRMPGCLQDGR